MKDSSWTTVFFFFACVRVCVFVCICLSYCNCEKGTSRVIWGHAAWCSPFYFCACVQQRGGKKKWGNALSKLRYAASDSCTSSFKSSFFFFSFCFGRRWKKKILQSHSPIWRSLLLLLFCLVGICLVACRGFSSFFFFWRARTAVHRENEWHRRTLEFLFKKRKRNGTPLLHTQHPFIEPKITIIIVDTSTRAECRDTSV